MAKVRGGGGRTRRNRYGAVRAAAAEQGRTITAHEDALMNAGWDLFRNPGYGGDSPRAAIDHDDPGLEIKVNPDGTSRVTIHYFRPANGAPGAYNVFGGRYQVVRATLSQVFQGVPKPRATLSTMLRLVGVKEGGRYTSDKNGNARPARFYTRVPR